jgi:phage gpG-like protein
MAVPLLPDFTKWSARELQNAQSAAIDFLNDNIQDIAVTFEKRLALMQRVAAQMKCSEAGFEERMMCLSMMQELAQGLGESAQEFFDIGCHPSVAKIVRSAQ